jgi:hypothetical protein
MSTGTPHLQWLLLPMLLIGMAQTMSAEPVLTKTIMVPMHPSAQQIDHEDYYFIRLLTLALDKTHATDGDYQLQEADIWLADNRLKAALKSNWVDVIWSNTSPPSEQALLPVRVSLLKELSDYRILIIRPGDQARFNAITTLDDLRKLKGGMGSQWPDMAVMCANDLPVVSSVGYGRLFRMLAAGRFDYFSRGLYQVKRELELYSDLGLVMEEKLILHYSLPYYFFVNRNNPALADRLERGLKAAQADGSFDQLLLSIPRHQWAKAELDKRHRRVLELALPQPEP